MGREALIADLAARVRGSCRLLFITGIAGVGKTALAERLSLELTEFGRPLRENFDAHDPAAGFSGFAARLLEKTGQGVTPSDRADSQQLLTRLVQTLQTSRRLILIDSLEELLQGNEKEGWSEFNDEAFLRCFQRVLSAEACQSRLILTSQELPTQLLAFGTRYQTTWVAQPQSNWPCLKKQAWMSARRRKAAPIWSGSVTPMRGIPWRCA